MKLGLVVESTVRGLENLVCPRILTLLAAEAGVAIEHIIVPRTNKKLLIQGSGETAKALFAKGCQRVVQLWDENPPWTPQKDFAKERCRHIEREHVLANLAAADVELAKVGLVCIEREFETWLLHDAPLVLKVMSSDQHPAKVKPPKNPMRIDDPKAALLKLFRDNKVRYNADVVARQFVTMLDSLDRIKQCDTFRYFAAQVLGKMPKGWKPYVYKRRISKS